MTIRERNGKWQIREMRGGKTKSITLSHKPTKKEAFALIQEAFENDKPKVRLDSFYNCADEYIRVKSNVLSPSTIREYKGIIARISCDFMDEDIADITQIDIQREINRLAEYLAPKTVRNYHAFITSVLAMFRPEMIIRTTLPNKVKQEVFIPSDDDVKAILTHCKAHKPNCYIALRLGCYGLRRSEIMAITKEDIKGNTLTIDKAIVLDSNKQWVLKSTKTTASTRKINIDSELARMIKKKGYAYNLHPSVLEKYLRTTEEALKIDHFSFHKLRHYFVSKCIDMGIDFITIRSWVGHNDLRMIQEVYAHKMKENVKNDKMIEIFKRDIL